MVRRLAGWAVGSSVTIEKRCDEKVREDEQTYRDRERMGKE